MVVRDDVLSTAAAVGSFAGLGIKRDCKFKLFVTAINEGKHRGIGSGSATIGCPHFYFPTGILASLTPWLF